MTTNNAVNISAAGLGRYDGAGTMTGVTVTDHAVLLGATGNGITSLALTNGQLAIGNTGNDPSASTLTAGTGVSITNGAGSITINSTGSGLTWQTVVGTTQAAAINNGYIANNPGTVTITLPAVAPFGSIIAVSGMNAVVGWRLACGTGQTIHFGNQNTTISTGYLQATNLYDSVTVVCNVANTEFIVLTSIGNLTVA